MLTKSQIKLITSLKQKKFRSKHKLFVAEGKKTISELIRSKIRLHQLYSITNEFDVSDDVCTIITPKELDRISFLKTPNTALALFEIPDPEPIPTTGLIVALDDVRDPGNLGTIIRLCDWFGVKDLVCSFDTVDCFNPKVVQATMGSIARVNITYKSLVEFLKNTELTRFGAFMDGENIYQLKLPPEGILVLGNEANGIAPDNTELLDKRIAIPRFGDLQKTESLNVANAAAILLSEFKRGSTEM